MYKSINNLSPERLSNLFQNSNTIYDYDLRGSSTRLCLPRPKTKFMKKLVKSFFPRPISDVFNISIQRGEGVIFIVVGSVHIFFENHQMLKRLCVFK